MFINILKKLLMGLVVALITVPILWVVFPSDSERKLQKDIQTINDGYDQMKGSLKRQLGPGPEYESGAADLERLRKQAVVIRKQRDLFGG